MHNCVLLFRCTAATAQDAKSPSSVHSVAGATKTDMTSPNDHVSSEDSSIQQSDADRSVDGTSIDADDTIAKRAMGMLRLGRAGSRQSLDNRRAMSALRLGRRGSWTPGSEIHDELAYDDGSELSEEKDKRKSMSMLRLGRGDENHLMAEIKDEEKKAAKAWRLGRKRHIDNRASTNDVSEDVSLQTAEEMSEARDDDIEKRAMGMLRLGRKTDVDESGSENALMESNDDEKRAMGMLRLGRQSPPSRIDRRKSMSMLRLG